MTFDDPGPPPAHYEQTIRTQLRSFLRDPDGIKDLRIAAPTRSECFVDGRRAFQGWKVDASFNSRNLAGDYAGDRTYFYWFQGERLWGLSSKPGACPPAIAWQ